jgi:hypothetical protein
MLEPGAGTQVSGDEEEYRRMLQVLLTQSGVGQLANNTPAVEVRREGDWVRVTTALGPDVAASGELERRWLSRMAVRLGGRYELLGKSHSLVLPADNDDRVELKALREELLQAQQLGQSYALELAQALSSADRGVEAEARASHAAIRWALGITARALPETSRQVFQCILAVDDAAPPGSVALAEALELALQTALPWAHARGISLSASPTDATCTARPSVLRAQLELLLLHAIGATVDRGRVEIRTSDRDGRVYVELEHGVETGNGGLSGRVAERSPAQQSPSLALLAAATLGPPDGAESVRTDASDQRCVSILCYPAGNRTGP